jgi:peptidyl-prolyl cis-trans isomerase C
MSPLTTRHTFHLIATLIATALVFPASMPNVAQAQETNKAIVTVDGDTLTEKDLELAKILLGASLEQIPEKDQRKQITNVLVETYLLANAAERSGVRETEAYKQRIKFLDLRALRDSYVDSEVRQKISETDVKARYSKEVLTLKPEVEVQARHILVTSEADAKALIKELDKGADFADLARKKSTGPSGPNGGDLGFFGPGRMVPAFDAVVFKMEPGTYTKKPVKTQFGWHVIKVEKKREVPIPPFEEVAEQIRRLLASERYTKVIENLRKGANIQMHEK